MLPCSWFFACAVFLVVVATPALSDTCTYQPMFPDVPVERYRKLYLDGINSPFNKATFRDNSSRFRNMMQRFRTAPCGVTGLEPDSAIMGGRISSNFEWTVDLQTVDYQHYCGGVQIASDWVLTAAHCLGHADAVVIIHGNHRGIKNMFPHPEYVSSQTRDDIALIQLDDPVCHYSYSDHACLPLEYQDYEKARNCYTSGWGKYDAGGEASSPLRVLKSYVMPQSICSYVSSLLGTPADERVLCLDKVNNSTSGPCGGDSGGPLSCQIDDKYYVAGIMSEGEINCTANLFPTVVMRVSFYTDWIVDTIMNNGNMVFC